MWEQMKTSRVIQQALVTSLEVYKAAVWVSLETLFV